jgi:hypothetical protein
MNYPSDVTGKWLEIESTNIFYLILIPLSAQEASSPECTNSYEKLIGLLKVVKHNDLRNF